MKLINRSIKLPAFFCAGSFVCLAALTLLTEPDKNVALVILFFVLLIVFLIATGYVLASLKSGKVLFKWRLRIVLISLFVTVALMFRSSQSLSFTDGLILLLIIGGIIFYTDKRFY